MPGVTELEAIAARGWQGTTAASLGEWLLRAGHGFTGRANSVLPLGSPGCGLDDALAAVAEFYRANELPGIFQIPEDFPGSELDHLDRELQSRGWRPYNTSAVLTAPVAQLLTACPPSATLPRAQFAAAPTAGWLAGYHYRGRPLPPSAVAVLVNAESPVFVTVADGDRSGVARGIVTDGWLGVTAVTVDPRCRRTGVGRHLMGELARWATTRPEPAHSIYLQVDAANEAALMLYGRLGFTLHHGYHYLAAPAGRTG